MILRIASKELFHNMSTSRFITGFLLCLLLIPFPIIISINEYRSKVSMYETEQKQVDDKNIVKVYSAYRPVIVKKPGPLSIFARGVSYNLGNQVKILFSDIPMMSEGKAESRDNPFLNRFFTFDFISVLIIIISLMAFLFTYDICTWERETGTLKMMLANPVSRASVLAGKMLGTFFTLLPMLLFSYGLCILVIMFYPDIHFTSSEWLRIGLIFLLSMVFLVLFMVIGLFVSSRVRHSGTGIVICLVLWITFLFIVPNLANYSAKSFVKVGSVENLEFNIKELNDEYLKKTEEYEKKLPGADWDMQWNTRWDSRDGFNIIGGASKSSFEKIKLKNEFTEPLRVDYADKKWSFRKAYITKLEKQQNFARYLSFLSPSEIFKESVNGLCATNAESHYNFLDQTRRYREELIHYYKEKKLFSSYLYFTQQDPKNFMTVDEIVNYLTKGELKSFAEVEAHKDPFYFFGKTKNSFPNSNIDEWKSIDLSQFPKFNYRPAKVLNDIHHSLLHIGVLFALALALFYFSYKSFIRYDVR
ncbi:MAG TPA: ABC transporter permease subunit [Bacteroidales bacterium]|nr:ABC transporter permease subunit [Bacteroidales bacterium]